MQNPFKTIGIGVAFSPNLKANLFEGARLALFFNATLVVIHVGEETIEKKQALITLLNAFKDQALHYKLIFKTGNPVNVILNASEKNTIDLLVIGAAKKEQLFTYYIGSIARKITRKAKCSILLLINPSVTRKPCRHMVVNGLEDPKTEQTIATAFYVASKLKSEKLTIVEEIKQGEIDVHVDDDKSLRKATIVKARIGNRERSRINHIIKNIPVNLTQQIAIKSQPIFGTQGYSIGHYAQIRRADLLVMNAPTKMTFLDRLFPHDIEHILSELPTDVLIVQ